VSGNTSEPAEDSSSEQGCEDREEPEKEFYHRALVTPSRLLRVLHLINNQLMPFDASRRNAPYLSATAGDSCGNCREIQLARRKSAPWSGQLKSTKMHQSWVPA